MYQKNNFDEQASFVYKEQMTRFHFVNRSCLRTVFLMSALTILCAVNAYSQGTSLAGSGPDPKLLAELQYVEWLNGMGMASYAQIVLERIPKSPGLEVHLKRLQIQSFIAIGKWDEVKKIIAKESDQGGQVAWGLKLAMADGYYAWGKYKEAQTLYDGFFAKFPTGPPDGLNDFYMDSAYKYAQMLLLMGDKPAAMKAYQNVLKAEVPKHVLRQIWGETAELMLTVADSTKDEKELEALIKQVEELCDKILWVQDLWFGKAIVYLAHIEVLRGKPENAEKLIKQYKPSLEAIDRSLQENSTEGGDDLTKLSPMAECRYLIGKMMQDVALQELERGNTGRAIILLLGKPLSNGKRTNGALHHFINVFIRYPSTSWAPDAGVRVEDIKKIAVEDLGAKKIKFTITPKQWEAVRKAQFLEARSLFNRQMFPQAIDSYVKVLNLFPEGETSIAAISELARCYVETEAELEAEMTMRYLAECFSQNEETQGLAGDKLLSLAGMYDGLGALDKKDDVHNLYFKFFTKHPRAAAMLFQFGERKITEENYAEALLYFTNIIENHKKSSTYAYSLFKASICYGKLGKRTSEIKILQQLVATLEKEPVPDILLLTSKFSIAQGYRELAKGMLAKKDSDKHQQAGNKYMMAAAGKYFEIITLLSKPDHPYKVAEEQIKISTVILEGALYNKAQCYMYMSLPKEKVGQYKARAIQGYKELVAKFPKSVYAPQSLSHIVTLYSLFGKVAEAQDAVKLLKKNYKGTPQEENINFINAMNLLAMGRRKAATKAFREVISGKGNYSAQKIMVAGTELMNPDVALYDVALEAFEKALTMSNNRTITEPSRLGQGQALTELGQFEKATEVLDKLMLDFPKSGYTVDTGSYLARAASTHAMTLNDEDTRFEMFNKAMAALKRVRKFVGDDVGMKAKTDLEIGLILEKKAEAEKKFGTEEKQKKYQEDAIGAYQIMMMFSDARDPKVRPHLDDAYKQCLALMFDIAKWDDVVQDAEKYLKQFKAGKHMSAIRTLKNKAVVKQRIAGGPATPATETATPAPEAESTTETKEE